MPEMQAGTGNNGDAGARGESMRTHLLIRRPIL